MLCFFVQAQKSNNVWAFGINGGLNFNTTPVSSFKSKAAADEPIYYISSICDKNGNLLIYTNGRTVWNSDNKVMPKHNDWWFLSGEKLMPLLCPYPDNDSLFYLFGIGDGINPYQLQYITTMIKKPGDVEEVVYPIPSDPEAFHTKLLDNASIVLAGTNHCNRKDYWIVTYSNHALYSFLVSSAGVSKTPVVTPVPTSIIQDNRIDVNNSNIKFSASGEKLIIPLISNNRTVVFDFNNNTGSFSNAQDLALPKNYILDEAELSPDGTKLYVGYYESKLNEDGNPEAPEHYIGQMDLEAGTTAQITASFVRINDISDMESCTPHFCFLLYRAMQVGPDGRIYIGMRYVDIDRVKLDLSLSVIEEPNKKGRDCRYSRNIVNVGTKYKFLGYNYIRSSSFTPEQNGIQVQQKTCSDRPVEFSLLFKEIDSVRWDFGDTRTGNNNFSTALNPQHVYPGPGTYQAKAIIHKSCNTDTAFKIITIGNNPAVHVPQSIRDTTICNGEQLVLNARTPTSTSYSWENGLFYPDRTITQPGQYQVTVMNDCSVDRKDFTVTYQQCPCNVFMPNAFTPNGDGINDIFKPRFECTSKDYHLKIFDRYGRIIFESSESSRGWDGNIRDGQLPTGVYVWMMEYRNPNNKQVFRKNGTVTLIR
jgi:gliding motility-associated-like protein